MIGTNLKSTYKVDIRCPCCKKKLMIINLPTIKKLKVAQFCQEESGKHNIEIKCHMCKSYVAIDIHKK